MRLTVLGRSPSWPDAGGACSGYLVQSGGTCLLLDCGTGVFGQLRCHADYAAVDAVLLSHLHADHILDLVPYASALTYSERWSPGDARPRPALYGPPGTTAVLARLGGALGEERMFAGAFAIREFDPARAIGVGPLALTFAEVPHFIPAWAIRVDDGGPGLTYGSDSGPNDAVAALARGTGVLVLEATLGDADPPAAGLPAGHMSAAQAGRLAREAGAGRLLLTHFSDELDADAVDEQARRAFGGPVELARTGLSLDV